MVEQLARMSPGTRRALQVAAVACLAVGGLMFLGSMFTMVSDSPDVRDPNFIDESNEKGQRFIIFGMGGILVIGLGGAMARFAFMKPVSEIVATETSGAVEHSSTALGRGIGAGLAQSGHTLGGVRVRCRACGFLDSEDAKFCSSCGGAM